MRFDYSAVVTAAYIAANAINAHMLPSPFVTLLNDFTQQPQETAGPWAGLHKQYFPSDPRPSSSCFVAGMGQEKTGSYEAGFYSSLPTVPTDPSAWHDVLTLSWMVLFLLLSWLNFFNLLLSHRTSMWFEVFPSITPGWTGMRAIPPNITITCLAQSLTHICNKPPALNTNLPPQLLSFRLYPTHTGSALGAPSPCHMRLAGCHGQWGCGPATKYFWAVRSWGQAAMLCTPGSMVSQLQPGSDHLFVTWPRQHCIMLWGREYLESLTCLSCTLTRANPYC